LGFKEARHESGCGGPVGDDNPDAIQKSNSTRSLQHENLQLNDAIEELVQSRSIKGDVRLTFRKGFNVGRCRCCVFLGREIWRTNKGL
jgi:hypothetical protein